MRPSTTSQTCTRCGWQFSGIGRNSALQQLREHEQWCKLETQVLRDIRRSLLEMTHGGQTIPERVTPCATLPGVFHVWAGTKKYLFYRETRELVDEDQPGLLRVGVANW